MDLLYNLLSISIVFSVILMTLIQKIKTLSFVKKSWQIWIFNLILSFSIGIPFAITFYDVSLTDGIWVGLFSFIGAPTLYDVLQNQNIINYKPISLSEKEKESSN